MKIRDGVLFAFCVCILSLMIVMTIKVYPVAIDWQNVLNYSIEFHVGQDWKIWLIVITIVGISIRYLFKFVSKTDIMTNYDKEENFLSGQKQLLCFSFILNAISWGNIFLLIFPGAAMNDTINCIISPTESAGMQPLLFEGIIYWGIYVLEKLTGNVIYAYAGMTICQMLFCSLVTAYAVVWLYRKKIKPFVCYLVAAGFGLSPIVADYSVTLVKDSCFAFFFLLLLIQVYDLLREQINVLTRWKIIKIVITVVFVTLFRTNGIIVTVFLLAVLFFTKRVERKKMILIIFTVICITQCNRAAVSYYDHTNVSFREATGVLTMQMAAVIARDGNRSEVEEDFLDQVLPIEEWKSKYLFSFVDPIKFHADFNTQFLNSHKSDYIKIWWSLLKKNLKIYVDAYLFHTYQLWNLASFDRSCLDYSQSVFTRINNNTSDNSIWGKHLETIGLKNESVYPEGVQKPMLDTFVRACEINLLLSPGWIILIFLICVFFSLIKRCWMELCFTLPIVFMWMFFMVATPAAGPFRYSYYLLVTLPFSILLTWKGMEEKIVKI